MSLPSCRGLWVASALALGQLGLCSVPDVAQAADLGPHTYPAPSGRLFGNEFRIGAGIHDIETHETGASVSGEFLSRWAALSFNFPGLDTPAALRPTVGGHLSLEGKTSYVFAGYTLSIELLAGFFMEGRFGGMLHNGELDSHKDDRVNLGCPVLFNEAFAMGYRFNDRWNMTTSLEHSSNGGICQPNNGLTNVNMRLGYMF